MIVDRRIYNFKLGHVQEALKLVKTEFAALVELGISPPYRIYVSRFGRFSQVAIEWEFENLAAQDAFWEAWRPASPEFIDAWFGIIQDEIQIEIWDLVERD